MRKRGAALLCVLGGVRMAEGTQELLEVLDPEILFLREKISIPKRAPGSKSKQVSLVIVLYCALGQAQHLSEPQREAGTR